MPDSRELASLLWLGAATAWALSRKQFRSSFGGVLRAFFNPLIFLPLSMMFGYIGLEVWVGSKLSIWRLDLLKPTVLWALGSAAVLFFKSSEAAREPGFFRKTVRETVAVSVFVEFFMNLKVMSLVAELLLIPIVVIFSLIPVAATKPSDLPAKRLSEVMLAVIGFSLVAFTVRQIYLTRAALDVQQVGLQFVLPIWLTVGILPFIAIWRWVLTYDWAMRGITWATTDRRTRWRTRFVLAARG